MNTAVDVCPEVYRLLSPRGPQNNFPSIIMESRNPQKYTGQKCIYSDKKMFIKRGVLS